MWISETISTNVAAALFLEVVEGGTATLFHICSLLQCLEQKHQVREEKEGSGRREGKTEEERKRPGGLAPECHLYASWELFIVFIGQSDATK